MGDNKALEDALVSAVHEIFEGDREALSVNHVRKEVETDRGLPEGFFGSAEWKSKSKTIIKGRVDELVAAEENGLPPPSKPNQEQEKSKAKNGPVAKKGAAAAAKKRAAPAKKAAPPKKRQKKVQTKSEEEEESSELSEPDSMSEENDEEEEEDSEEETTKKRPMKRAPKKSTVVRGKGMKGKRPTKRKEAVSSDEEDQEEKHEEKADEAKGNAEVSTEATGVKNEVDEQDTATLSESLLQDTSAANKDDDQSSELSSILDDDPPPKKNQRKAADPPASKEKADKKKKAEEGGDSSSELSSIIDDPPPKKKTKPTSKEATAKKGRKGSLATDDNTSPDEAEIKKLQSQLVKCGVRKIWGIELKKYGKDDTKGKIRHLRDMLREIGIDGRFSEAKAREIKERRELAAELEAVNEMNDLWGMGGRRARRGAAPSKNLKDSGDDEENQGDEIGDGDDNVKARKQAGNDDEKDEIDDDAPKGNSARRRKVRPELAFLGDESDSD